jgi:Protein of unknown function (DUF1116)
MAATIEEADEAIRAGRIRLAACHDHGCVGSVAGIYTASMPVRTTDGAVWGPAGAPAPSEAHRSEGKIGRRLATMY